MLTIYGEIDRKVAPFHQYSHLDTWKHFVKRESQVAVVYYESRTMWCDGYTHVVDIYIYLYIYKECCEVVH